MKQQKIKVSRSFKDGIMTDQFDKGAIIVDFNNMLIRTLKDNKLVEERKFDENFSLGDFEKLRQDFIIKMTKVITIEQVRCRTACSIR